MLQLQRIAGNQAVQRAMMQQQSRPIGPEGGDVSDGVQRQITQARGGGQALDKTASTQIGSALGADFSSVRVHTDARADMINRSLSAKAATVGNDIFFSKGAYSPGSAQGQRLLAHELTHVVQQGAHAGSTMQPKLKVGPANDAHEQEAARVSAGMATPQLAKAYPQAGGAMVQRLLMSADEFKTRMDEQIDDKDDRLKKTWQRGLDKNQRKAVKRFEQQLEGGDAGGKSFGSSLYAWVKSRAGMSGSKQEQEKGETIDADALLKRYKEKKFDVQSYGLVLDAYKNVEADPDNLGNLARLHDEITAWQTKNYMLLTRTKGDKKNAFVLQGMAMNSVLQQTLDDVKSEFERKAQEQGGDSQTFSEMLGGRSEKEWQNIKLPLMFENVGISRGYYKDHLQGKPAEPLLEKLYEALAYGDLAKASALLANPVLTALPGFPMIRSLFLAHFRNEANLGDLAGVKQQQGKLTAEELAALKAYTGSSTAANATMRSVDLSKEKTDAALNYKHLVSAISKLPPHQGIAYRGITPFSGIDAVWQVGATFADLAFTSAAASFRGVETYLKNNSQDAVGSQNYYCIIHSKSAVHISDRSKIREENEVLFRPGTRFKIKAIWQHNAGSEKVPPNAPAAAQMILHRVGKYKTETGKDKHDWVPHRLLADNDPGEFKDQKNLQQVKVFEMVEL